MAHLVDEISFFLPAYNLENYIERSVKDTASVLSGVAGKYEIIVIDDGSRDRTAELVSELAKKYEHVRLVTHEVNKGYGAALRSGFYSCRYPWIAFMDADGQFDPQDLPELIEKQKASQADLVVGYYIKRAVRMGRKLNTWLWQLVVRLIFGIKIRDIDCGFKLISKRVIDTIPKLESERGAFISSELLIKAQKCGFRIVEVGVRHYPREAGATGANLNVIIKSFVDLFRLWEKLR